jgi:hypothetical protein
MRHGSPTRLVETRQLTPERQVLYRGVINSAIDVCQLNPARQRQELLVLSMDGACQQKQCCQRVFQDFSLPLQL